MDKKIKELQYSSSLNSITLTSLINVLVEKNMISHEEMQKAFEKARTAVEQGDS